MAKNALTPMMGKKENKKIRRMVSVDIDGTLAKYEFWQGVDVIGEPIEGSREFLKKISEFAKIQIYTSRANAKRNKAYTQEQLVGFIKKWLDDNDMPYNSIYVGEGKPASSAFVDDRAVSCRAQNDRGAYEDALEATKELCEIDKDDEYEEKESNDYR